MDVKEIEKVVELMRRTGVAYLKTADLELTLGPAPVETQVEVRQEQDINPLTKEQEYARPYFDLR